MEWKLQLFSTALYLFIILCGLVFIPREPPLFGMGMIPGPLAILRALGLPLISSGGISIAVYRKSRARKVGNTVFFFVCSIILWIFALGLIR
jgi:hypothetical protein